MAPFVTWGVLPRERLDVKKMRMLSVTCTLCTEAVHTREAREE